MKQKDIALIGVIVILSGVISFIVSGKLFASPKDRQQAVEKVEVITSDFPQPSAKYFNVNSVNPTPVIQIGNNNNQNPFSAPSQ